MSTQHQKYCLDANVLIQAWQKYYSPKICPNYWDILNHLGQNNKIFLPQMVYEEMTRTDDDLAKWLKSSSIPEIKIDEQVANCLKSIYAANPSHIQLVDNTKQRSLADPWVIAHAMNEGAVIVTKEEKVTALNSTKVKIPNVCENMGIRYINDFEFIQEMGLRFTCIM